MRHKPKIYIYIHIYIYIYILLLKSPHSNNLCDHSFMDVIKTPIARQSKIVYIQNGCLHVVKAALTCVVHKVIFSTAWRLVFWLHPWNHGRKKLFEFDFSTTVVIIRACACWALFVATLTNTVHLIYDIYIFIYGCIFSLGVTGGPFK